ncbi:MAG TPA: A24 family peptidase [Arthrobacter sp.]
MTTHAERTAVSTAMEAHELEEAGVPGIYEEPAAADWLPWLQTPAITAVVGGMAAVAGIAGGIAGAGHGPVTAFAYAVLCASLVVLSAIDLKTMLLPNIIVGPLNLLIPVAGLLGYASKEYSPGQVLTALACAAGCVAIMWIFTFATGGFGDGDVKLIGVLGFVLGLQGPAAAGLGALIGPMLLGAVVALPLIFSGRGGRTPIPFGPFMAAGTMIVLFFPGLPTLWLQ